MSEAGTPMQEARQIGLDLLQGTSRFDSRVGVKHGIGPVDLALVAFAVRARRALRSAYRLLDAGEPDTANIIYRAMSEYLIVGRWLMQATEAEMQAWALFDLRDRRKTLLDVLDAGTELDEESRAAIQVEVTRAEEAIRSYGGPTAALSKRAARKAGEDVPSLESMAKRVGMGFGYSLAYRVQSQTDVHATALAVDSVFEDACASDPGPRIRETPRSALHSYNAYQLGAHLLLDVLRPVAERLPELAWEEPLAEIDRRLQRLPPFSGRAL
jgi:Family of unknown function (DUF5677)